ncbi:MAG: flagellar hook-length control protein FliK [Actinomycetota bacterium]|nr:flagellar hook-length control protein FliK [Actinomycetota bacterium]
MNVVQIMAQAPAAAAANDSPKVESPKGEIAFAGLLKEVIAASKGTSEGAERLKEFLELIGGFAEASDLDLMKEGQPQSASDLFGLFMALLPHVDPETWLAIQSKAAALADSISQGGASPSQTRINQALDQSLCFALEGAKPGLSEEAVLSGPSRLQEEGAGLPVGFEVGPGDETVPRTFLFNRPQAQSGESRLDPSQKGKGGIEEAALLDNLSLSDLKLATQSESKTAKGASLIENPDQKGDLAKEQSLKLSKMNAAVKGEKGAGPTIKDTSPAREEDFQQAGGQGKSESASSELSPSKTGDSGATASAKTDSKSSSFATTLLKERVTSQGTDEVIAPPSRAEVSRIDLGESKESGIATPLPAEDMDRAILDQVVKKVQFFLKEGKHEAKIDLEPKELGSIKIKITVEGGLISAKFEAINPLVKEALESNLANLKQSLTEKGFSMGAVQVSVGGDLKGEGRQSGDNIPNRFKGRSHFGVKLDEGAGLSLGRTYGLMAGGGINYLI